MVYAALLNYSGAPIKPAKASRDPRPPEAGLRPKACPSDWTSVGGAGKGRGRTGQDSRVGGCRSLPRAGWGWVQATTLKPSTADWKSNQTVRA